MPPLVTEFEFDFSVCLPLACVTGFWRLPPLLASSLCQFCYSPPSHHCCSLTPLLPVCLWETCWLKVCLTGVIIGGMWTWNCQKFLGWWSRLLWTLWSFALALGMRGGSLTSFGSHLHWLEWRQMDKNNKKWGAMPICAWMYDVNPL